MRIALLAAPLVLLAWFALFAHLGCARTTQWQGGDACTQLSKNAEEIRDLEARMTRLRADGPAADPARRAEAARLEERKHDLQRNNARLAGGCAPPEGTVPDYQQRRRERFPETR